jgi:hypothetical protein
MRLFQKTPAPAHDAAHAHGHSDAALRAAYERGRREERARHRRSPFLVLGLATVALVGAASLGLAALNGSFREGGAAMDAGVATAAREAVPTIKKGAAAVQDTLSSDAQASDAQASSSKPAG